MPSRAQTALTRVRRFALSLADVTERPSHGAPAWFVKKSRCFVMFADNHHGDGRLALWCAAPPGAQAMLVEMNPDAYFVPAYVGVGGWVGLRLDRKVSPAEVENVIEQAHRTRLNLLHRR
jgi:hypothetical protein